MFGSEWYLEAATTKNEFHLSPENGAQQWMAIPHIFIIIETNFYDDIYWRENIPSMALNTMAAEFHVLPSPFVPIESIVLPICFFVPSLQCTTRRFNIAARRTQTENELKRVQQIMRENKEMEEREWHRRKKDYSIYFIRFPLNYCHFFTNQVAWFGERFWFTKRRSSAI